MDASISVRILLENHVAFDAKAFGDFSNPHSGEFVFCTAMTGIEESLSDPSFSKQIIISTLAHVGNTGVNEEDAEAKKIYAAGLVCRHLDSGPKHWRLTKSLESWLVEQKKFVVFNVDTRKLTQLIRDEGSQRGLVFKKDSMTDEQARAWLLKNTPVMASQNLASEVSTQNKYTFEFSKEDSYWPADKYTTKLEKAAGKKIAVWDFGVKTNTLRILKHVGFDVEVLPLDYDFGETNFDGLLLSNGPGDPSAMQATVEKLKSLIGKFPIFGICLGHQLLAQAMGAKTIKMPFGHRGIHHPVNEYDLDGQVTKTWITSQNHGFVVDEKTLPSGVQVRFRHANDLSVEGISWQEKNCYSVQFHPEAAPGPFDAFPLFEPFFKEVCS